MKSCLRGVHRRAPVVSRKQPQQGSRKGAPRSDRLESQTLYLRKDRRKVGLSQLTHDGTARIQGEVMDALVTYARNAQYNSMEGPMSRATMRRIQNTDQSWDWQPRRQNASLPRCTGALVSALCSGSCVRHNMRRGCTANSTTHINQVAL